MHTNDTPSLMSLNGTHCKLSELLASVFWFMEDDPSFELELAQFLLVPLIVLLSFFLPTGAGLSFFTLSHLSFPGGLKWSVWTAPKEKTHHAQARR